MHIARLRIQNFRCFRNTTVEFQPGLNVIIGENNAGKTALLTALRLVLDRGSVSLSVHDIHYEALKNDAPPSVEVTATFISDESDTPEDRAVVATWLTRDESPWEAELSFVYELPAEYHDDYRVAFAEAPGEPSEKARCAVELMQERRRLVTRYFGGDPKNRFTAEPEWLTHFQGRYLDAIRDAERDLHSGRATLLRQMLRRVLDTRGDEKTQRAQREDFRVRAEAVMTNIRERLDVDHLFDLAVKTWSKLAGTPALSGQLNERDLLDVVVLLLDRQTYRHPVTHGGLGYNNLLYVALVLASTRPLEGETDRKIDVAFHALLVEEPEAHLHPALQYRFLAFLKRQLRDDIRRGYKGSRQLFLTSHSTHVSAAVGLDSLCCLYLDQAGNPHVAYPGRAFGPKQQASKAYVERFLDATKSSLLFAKSVLFVEGIAEQLLVPRLADLALTAEEDPSLLDRNYVAVVRVDGVTFVHFLPLFGMTDDPHSANGLRDRRVACLTDSDPVMPSPTMEILGSTGRDHADEDERDEEEHDEHEEDERDEDERDEDERDEESAIVEATSQEKPIPKRKRKRLCWPYHPGAQMSTTAVKLLKMQERFPERLHVGVSSKTFEYDFAYENANAVCLVTDVAPIRMRGHLRALIKGTESGTEAHWIKWRSKDADALALYRITASQDDIHRASVASYYLRAVEEKKGENASALAEVLATELLKPLKDRTMVKLPEYVTRAIRWLCTLEPPIEGST